MANCPKSTCKDIELLPARTRESNSAIDGLKCPHCDTLYRFNNSNHLVPLLQDKDLKPGISREGFAKVLQEVTRPIKNDPVPGTIVRAIAHSTSILPVKDVQYPNDYHKVSDQDAATITQRLNMGDSPAKIAADMKFKKHQIVYLQGKLLKEGKLKKSATKTQSQIPEEVKAAIRTKVAAGVATSVICKELHCKPWAVYYYGGSSPKPPSTSETKTKALHHDVVKLAESFLDSDFPIVQLTIRMATNGFVVTDMENDEFTYTNLPDLLQVITEFFGEPIPCNPTRKALGRDYLRNYLRKRGIDR